MRSTIKTVGLLLVSLMTFSASSCSRAIKFDPDFHIGDYTIQAIVPEEGAIVYADSEEFNQFGCMHRIKIIELNEILRKARVPKQIKIWGTKK